MNKKEFIDNLLNKMSLEEKIKEMCQKGFFNPKIEERVRNQIYGSTINGFEVNKINKLQKIAVEETKRHIPLLFGQDVIHGYKTAYPIPLACASSFNMDLIEKNAKNESIEARASGINYIFNPMLDIALNPRWGRTAESPGEDPYLGYMYGYHKVKGIQHINKDGHMNALACAKHYVCYSTEFEGLEYNFGDTSEFMLKDTYLPPFEGAIDAGIKSIMTSFSTFDGVPATCSKHLLKDILRDELGFDGVIVSDWESVKQIGVYQLGTPYQITKRCLEATLDIDMNSDTYRDNLLKVAQKNPKLIKLIEESARRVLEAKYDIGLFDNPYVDESVYDKVILCDEHKKDALDLAKESIVLLKNEKVLPLNDEKVLFVGPYVYNKEDCIGTWAYDARKEDVISIYVASKDNKNISFFEGTNISFDNQQIDYQKYSELLKEVDKVVIFIGEYRWMTGENASRLSLAIPGNQIDLVKYAKKQGKKVITYVISGRPLILTEIEKYSDALIWSGQLGTMMGEAIYDTLFGLNNPSAKLPITFPKHEGQIPIFYRMYRNGRPDLQHFIDGDMTPLYKFGYGLSYTSFKISNLKILNNKINKQDSLKIEFDVQNTGSHTGKEIIEIYYSKESSIKVKPHFDMCGFIKIELMPNESKKISYEINTKFLRSVNNKNKKVVEKGKYSLYVGSNLDSLIEERFDIA